MYEAPAFGDPQIYETINWLTGSVRVIPQVGGAPAIPDVAIQPRCIIERIGEIERRDLSGARSMPQEVIIETIYRISSTGFGTNTSTTSNLQTMFRRQ